MAQKLEIGEKYLSISLLGTIKLAAFKNRNKKKPEDPDFLGNGIAIWVAKKRKDNEGKEYEVEDVI